MTMQEPTSTAIININPAADIAVSGLSNEIQKLVLFSERTVASMEDVKLATDDLALISKLKRAIEDKRKEYVQPLNEWVKGINDYFKTLTEPLNEADRINRQKILAFNAEVRRKADEAAAINRDKDALAKREAALNNGEITVDTTPVVVPAPMAKTVYSDTGSINTKQIWKFEVTDFSLLPAEYKIVDAVKLGKVVRAGLHEIPGCRIWAEDTLAVSGK